MWPERASSGRLLNQFSEGGKMFRTAILVIAILTLGLNGCARVPADPAQTSLLFGHIDTTGAHDGVDMHWIQFMKTVPQKRPSFFFGKVDFNDGGIQWTRRPGYIWADNLLPGTYQVAEIIGGTSGVSVGRVVNYHFEFSPKEKNVTSIEVVKPGLYYLGAFKMVEEGEKNFNLVKVKSNEKAALQRLLLRNKNPYWAPIINARLAELSR
jgi:hypothetical protein